MPVTKGPANSGGQAVGSWGGRTPSEAWRIGFEPDGRPPRDSDSGSWSRDSSPFHTLAPGQPPEVASVLDEFTLAWERGEAPAVEEYLERLDPADCRGAVELIYREFCLAEAAGRRPEPTSVPRALSSARRRTGAAAGAARRVLAVVARPLGRVDARAIRIYRMSATRSVRTSCAESWDVAASPAFFWPSSRTWRIARSS